MPGFKKLFLSDTALVKSPPYVQYGVPLLLIAVVTILKITLTGYIGYKTPFLLYFGIIIITSRYFGSRPAVMIALLSTLITNFFFIEPLNSFSFGKEATIQMLVFMFECALMISLSNALSQAVSMIGEKDVLFRTLVEKSSEGIITINANGDIMYCSPSVQNIIGYTDQEFLALPAWQLLHEDELLEIREQFYRFAAHDGAHTVMKHRMKHKNGEYIWIESKMTNMLGEPPMNAVIANFTDITDRMISDKVREDFIGIASHELKTPLTSLKAYTQVLQSRFKDGNDPTSLSIINKTELQVTKVIQMVTNLLDVTSLEQKRLSLNLRQFDINLLVSEVAESMQQAAKKHTIITELEPSAQIWGDRERIGQVLTNLISNALKYSPDADTIRITTNTNNDQIVVSVYDKGIGIPQKDQDKVFDRFFRVDDAKKSFQGLGLGLYICSQIIEHHGGSIGVTSTPGQGSTFWFSLPVAGA